MALLFASLTLLYSAASSSDCPCKNASLCDNIQTRYAKELYGFGGGGSANISDPATYNWTYLTSIAFKQNISDDFMCTAHQNGVRLIDWHGMETYPFSDNLNV